MKQNKPSLINNYAKEPVEPNTEKKHSSNQEHKKDQFKNQKETYPKQPVKEQEAHEACSTKKKADQNCHDTKKCEDKNMKKKSC
jgi:hypothetical protein